MAHNPAVAISGWCFSWLFWKWCTGVLFHFYAKGWVRVKLIIMIFGSPGKITQPLWPQNDSYSQKKKKKVKLHFFTGVFCFFLGYILNYCITEHNEILAMYVVIVQSVFGKILINTSFTTFLIHPKLLLPLRQSVYGTIIAFALPIMFLSSIYQWIK